MGTCNFKPMKYGMPLVVHWLDFDAVKEAYEKEGEEFSELEYQLFCEDAYCNAREAIKPFNDKLKFHEITIKDGYYEGFQFYVDEIYTRQFDLDKESEWCIDNDDARYYFDMCRSEAIRKADSEKRKIKKFLMELEKDGYDILSIVARFSNGECIYKKL